VANRGDSRTRAQHNRAVRQEALRDQLQAQQHHLQVLRCADEIGNVSENDKDADVAVRKWKAKADIHLKVLNKYLPDLKSVDMTHDVQGALSEQLQEALARRGHRSE